MPRVREDEVEGYAHCPEARCPGYVQEKVPVIRRTTEFTFVDSDGDLPGVEKSFVAHTFVDEDKRACVSCGRAREVSEQPRKSYPPLSGHDPNGLLNYSFNASYVPPREDPKVAELEKQLAELRALVGGKQS